MQYITWTAWFLIVLGVALLAGCVAYLLPVRRLNDEHPYETDPLDAGEHDGRHQLDEGPTRRLGDSRLRHPEA